MSTKKREIIMPSKAKNKKQENSGEMVGLILENTINLQRNLIETTDELKNLNLKITQLLDIFEKASRTFEDSLEKGMNTDVVELEKKIDSLVEQNRVIAKGLLLLERSTRSGSTKIPITVSSKIKHQIEPEPELEENEDKSDYSF